MSGIFIRGELLNKHFKAPTEQSTAYHIYQFQIKNNDGLYLIVNVYSKIEIESIELNKEVELQISVSLFNNQIIYEYKKA
ncbi:MAG: hypothetical protein PHG81_11920 [Aliarcobacter sp.]|nr:hypothetical protein [Aliarcobacter sp.]